MKRAALLLLAGLGAVPLAPGAAPAHAEAARFQPRPGQAMILSRTVIRALPDGNRIIATRRYRVRFAQLGGGWRIDGELVSSEIEAPPPLHALAELERTRPDDGLFPIVLDGAGRIASAPRWGDGERAAVDQAIAQLNAQLAQNAHPADAAEDRAFLARLRATASAPLTAQWPSELFLPGAETHRQARDFALPDGSEGRFASEFTRAGSADGHTMGRAERRVVTTIAGSESTSLEQWTLAPEG